jgi:hypothetical protein
MRSSKFVFATLLILGMLGSLVFAKELDVATKRLDKTFGLAQANGPALSTLNINNLQVWVRRDAALPPQGANGSSADYPKGTTNFIYAESMMVAIRVSALVVPPIPPVTRPVRLGVADRAMGIMLLMIRLPDIFGVSGQTGIRPYLPPMLLILNRYQLQT